MHVRRLNSSGLARFKQFLEESRQSDNPIAVPEDVLCSRDTSSGLNVSIEIDPRNSMNSKMQLARYLYEVLAPLSSDAGFRRDGMWSWLGLAMFDTLCPINPSTGQRTIYRDWYYVFQPDDGFANYQTYYRHLLYTPYHVYRSFQGEAGRVLLVGQPHVGGDMNEQIASRQEYISCRAVLEALDHLYLDDTGEGLKRGTTDRARSGNLRRFIVFLQQIDSTYDLYGMNGKNILDLLPQEYDDWR